MSCRLHGLGRPFEVLRPRNTGVRRKFRRKNTFTPKGVLPLINGFVPGLCVGTVPVSKTFMEVGRLGVGTCTTLLLLSYMSLRAPLSLSCTTLLLSGLRLTTDEDNMVGPMCLRDICLHTQRVFARAVFGKCLRKATCLRDATCLRQSCLREASALAHVSSLRHISSPDLSSGNVCACPCVFASGGAFPPVASPREAPWPEKCCQVVSSDAQVSSL